jgi:hypothetical protein
MGAGSPPDLVDPQDRSGERDDEAHTAGEFQRRGPIEAANHGLERAVRADGNDFTGVRRGRLALVLGIGSRSQ